MTIKTLTPDEFNAIRPHLERFEGKNVEAVRRILVEGAKQKDIAIELELSKEAVSTMVGRAWNLHLKHGRRPPGWETVTVALPPDYVKLVKLMANIARGRKTEK